MRIHKLRWLTPLAIALLMMAAGCEESPTEADEDLAAIESLILEEADLFTADLFNAQGAEDPDTPIPGKALEDIVPWRWGRQILDVSREIDIDIDDPADGPATASVTWNATWTGVFHVIDTTAAHYSKDFTDDAVRYATFIKSGAAGTAHRGWRLDTVSGTTIMSDPNTVQITSVTITSTDGIDTTFTDVSTLREREDLITFAPTDTVTITVTTGNPDDIVMIHYPAWATGQGTRNHVRRRLRSNQDGTFTGQWITRGMVWRNGQLRNPPRHVTIEVLSHGTIFTDDEPYDSMAWGFPYIVRSP